MTFVVKNGPIVTNKTRDLLCQPFIEADVKQDFFFSNDGNKEPDLKGLVAGFIRMVGR